MTISELGGLISGLYLRATATDGDQGSAISEREAAKLADAARSLIRAAEELQAALLPKSKER